MAAIIDALGVTVAVTGLGRSALGGFPQSTRAVQVSAAAPDPLAVITELTRVTLERTRLLCVHAGVVHGVAGAMAFPGRSGLGKSTLTAALMLAGFEYLSDEVLALHTNGLVHSFPRPITLRASARALLNIKGCGENKETLVPFSSLGSHGPLTSKLSSVFLLERTAHGASSMVPAKRSDAVMSLVEHSFNGWHDSHGTLSLLVRLVSTTEVWRIAYSDANDLASLLHSKFA